MQAQVKLALSRRLCGLLIGHKGQTVRDFISDSGASIRVQSLSELTPSDPERTITVSGARDQVLRAVALILNTVRQAGGRACTEGFPVAVRGPGRVGLAYAPKPVRGRAGMQKGPHPGLGGATPRVPLCGTKPGGNGALPQSRPT